MDLCPQDRSMVRLYMASCLHNWEQLPDFAREYYGHGASVAQLRGCVRHLVVFAGYGPCLAATLALHKAKLLPEHTPAKVAGPPGNAFELVYGGVTDRVRANMHAADPALEEWIRLHLYGDVYSSPGLDMRQKQLLTCAFLSEANMPDQLFGHALAGLRFGNSCAALQEVARLACEMGLRAAASRDAVLNTALNTLDMACSKYCKDMAGQQPSCPDVTIQEPELSVCIPTLPPPVNCLGAAQVLALDEQQVVAQPGTPVAAGDSEQVADANISLSTSLGTDTHGELRQAGCEDKVAGGWGTSNVCRPRNLAVSAIAARMEQQRARSGLFFAWDVPAQEGEAEQ